MRYWFINMLQEALLALAGIAPDTTATVFTQVGAAIQTLIAGIPHAVQTFAFSGAFTVPAGVTAVEVELWAGGSGSWASVSGMTGGGGSGGGYARKRISGLTAGGVATIAIGAGGTAGASGVAPGAGGASSVTIGGTIVLSATGGVVNPLGSVSAPSLGNIAGEGSGGDINLCGGDGEAGVANQGRVIFNLCGYGGDRPLSGGILNSGTTGNAGRLPGAVPPALGPARLGRRPMPGWRVLAGCAS